MQTRETAGLPDSPHSEDVGRQGAGARLLLRPPPATTRLLVPKYKVPTSLDTRSRPRDAGREQGQPGLAATAFYGRLWEWQLWERQVSAEKTMTQE